MRSRDDLGALQVHKGRNQMRLRPLLLLLAATLIPGSALAELKGYNGSVRRAIHTITLTITVQSYPNWRTMDISIEDTQNASPTLTNFQFITSQANTTFTDGFAGPGSYVHTRTISTTGAQPSIGSGDTQTFISWGTVTGWSGTGGSFCRSSNDPAFPGTGAPGPICDLVAFTEDGTIPPIIPSTSYDLMSWGFDGEGDFGGDNYIWQSNDGGKSNEDYYLKGQLNVNVPAMSVVGFGVLGASLLFLGVRSLRKSDAVEEE